jgi:cytoskeletal protein CcmA (bactofilin family)
VNKALKQFSLIDKNLTIDGTVQCKGRLIINGTLKGKLIGEHVIISKDGAVFADATATFISIAGKFDGAIRETKEVVILSTGICSGSVQCHSLVLDAGGVLNATVECLKKT